MEEHEQAETVADDGLHDAGVESYVEEAADHEAAHQGSQVIDVSGEMFLWTLGTFIAMAYVLTRIAWRPILDGLARRESYLRQSVENAQQVEQQLASINAKRLEVIAEADDQAKDILSRARRAGIEAERGIQDKARKEADILLENARREINAAREKSIADMKSESVDAAISLAGRLIGENLDTDKNRELTNRLIGQI